MLIKNLEKFLANHPQVITPRELPYHRTYCHIDALGVVRGSVRSYATNGVVLSRFALAVGGKTKSGLETTWLRCVAFASEVGSDALLRITLGARLAVQGDLCTNNYKGKVRQTVYVSHLVPVDDEGISHELEAMDDDFNAGDDSEELAGTF